MSSVRPGPVRRRLLDAALAACIAAGFATGSLGAGDLPLGPEPAAGAPDAGAPDTQPPVASIAVNADTGEIIAATNEHAPQLTASTIKVMTALVALEQLPSDATITVSELAARQPASKIDMVASSRWPLSDALASLLMVSANDAAYAIAETAGGNLEGFAAAATATGKRLGLRDTTFTDPAGLDGDEGFGGGTRSSAYDLAIVARNVLDIPAIMEPAGRVSYEFTDPEGAGRRLTNHNDGFLGGYPGAIGLKTGFTRAASRTFIGAARRGDRTCLAVVLGTWDDTGWAAHLLDQCFAAPAAGRGAKLPPVAALSFDARQAAFAQTPQAFGLSRVGRPATGPATQGPATPAPVIKGAPTRPTPTPAPSRPPRADADPAPPAASRQESTETDTPADPGDGGWTLGGIARTVGLTLLGLLVVVVLLRRRAVKRQRARRLAFQRAHAEARRRGMIDVVEADDSEIRLAPSRTSHHVSASGRRHPSDRKVVRPTRPRHHGASDPSR